MVVESIYYCVARTVKVFKKYKKQIKNKQLNKKMLDKIDSVFSIPPTIRNDREFISKYLERAQDSLETYLKLLKLRVKPPDAIFIVPRGLKLDVLQDYNFYNLIAGYYPLRICPTAEEELRRLTAKEIVAIKKLLKQKGLSWLAEHLVPKCHVTGFCLEEKPCAMIKSLVPDYNEKFHQEMMRDLEKKFQENFKKLSR
jgi:thymidylate synthase ThyX